MPSSASVALPGLRKAVPVDVRPEPGATRGHRAVRSEAKRTIMGVPERFMRPRVVLVVLVGILVAFGFLMIYSASSVMALSNFGDAAYYVKRQMLVAAVGTAAACGLARFDYRRFSGPLLKGIWVATVVALLATAALGYASHGAVRWITVAGVPIQPSELAKITVLLTAANLLGRRFGAEGMDGRDFAVSAVVGVAIPLGLILAQPDKGTTIILAGTIMVMAYLAGVDGRWILGFLGVAFLAFVALSMRDEYSRSRIVTMIDPWADPYGDGYQLIQGFYAFGSGGLFGVGLGLSRQKYSYLPEAHNDFIFAIVGEELGLVGALGVVAGFALFVYEGIQIARNAPDMAGMLIAAGCTSLIAIQFLVNVLGVLGVTPLTGKPVPFVSYGGSSILSCLLIVGLIVSVSRQSRLPETPHDARRRSMSMVGGEGAEEDPPGRARGRTGLTVLDGGSTAQAGRRKKKGARGIGSPSLGSGNPRGGYERIDLGPGASERLRGSGGPVLRDPGSTGSLGARPSRTSKTRRR